MNFSISRQQKYFLVLCLVSCLTVTAYAFTIYNQSQQVKKRDNWVIYTYEVLQQARLAVNNLLAIENAYQGYFLTGSSKFLVPGTAAKEELNKKLDQLTQTVSDNPDQLNTINEMRALIQKSIDLQDSHIARYQKRGYGSISVKDVDKSRQLMDEVRLYSNTFIDKERANLEERVRTARRENNRYRNTLFSGAALALIALLATNAVIAALLTRSHKAEHALREAEEIYKVVLQGMNDGIFDYNLETGSVRFSSNYKKQLGYDENELPDDLNAGLNLLVHPDDFASLWEEVHKYMRREIPHYSNIIRLRHKDGSWRWILSRGVGIWGPNGQIRRLIGVHTDITEQKRQEEALRELNAELESFTYIASHDLRSPLVNLKGFAEEIEYAIKNAENALQEALPQLSPRSRKVIEDSFQRDVPEALGFIHTAVDRMDALTNAILNLSRIGRREYKSVAIDMAQMIQRCLDSQAFEINRNNITVTVEETAPVIADPLAVEQVFSNIIDNAIKYLDPGRKGEIVIRSVIMPQEIIYSIQDSGRGISEKESEKVFDIFRRASNTGNVRGAGMGMAYVKATLRKLGGRIWFSSIIDHGTTFYIAFPTQPKGTS